MRPLPRATIGWYWTRSSPRSIARRRSFSSCRTATARSCMVTSNTACLAIPMPLARYMAVSASRSRSSGRIEFTPPPSAMPIDAEVKTSCPSMSKGIDSSRCTRSATREASAAVSTPSTSTANSSPPRRATVSPARRVRSRRREIWMSSWSPARWPSESLTTLKRSRSRKSTAKPPRPRPFARSRAIPRRSMNSARFGSPVSAS